MFTHQLDEHLALKLISEEDADKLYTWIDEDRAEFSKWLAWANDMQSVDDETGFINHARHQFADGKMLPLTLVIDGHAVGSIDLHNIDSNNAHAEIGYWLSSRYQGQGLMTRAVDRLLTIGFDELNLHKIILNADVNNKASQAVAERLNMHFDGTLRDHVLINDTFQSLATYSMLESEWEARS
ncbi:GNAT family N-acetyltransferase [Furfurilactobacillus sp. WILCCON 0119]|uniref:GNAT family N-acetyltransferase n=1 Tax=Furfurilactobacillus entadae TaxID=2922307 RepID=UPI0035E4D79F